MLEPLNLGKPARWYTVMAARQMLSDCAGLFQLACSRDPHGREQEILR
jgi:hypothetical protein